MIRLSLLAALVCFSAGCGSSDPADSKQADTTVDLSSLPVTVEGRLVADVSEGDVDDEGESEYSEINFGTLTVGSNEIMVQVSGSVLRSANLPEAGGDVRATLGSKSDEHGPTYYEITSLEHQ
jgi:hypothetical protein